MRKLVIVIVATLVPIGMWTAGCRENNQAAFPKVPEMKSIARAPEQSHPTRPPIIPAAIDREVLASPDQPTYARIRAVMDRSELMANRSPQPGLFVLPDEYDSYSAPEPVMATSSWPAPTYQYEPIFVPMDEPVVASLPEPAPYYQPVPAAPSAGPEFWSRPARPLPDRDFGGAPLSGDVSAMMPAAAPAPTPVVDDVQLPNSLVPESIPGVFMGTEASTPPEAGWLGFSGASGARTGPVPTPIAIDAFASVSVDEVNHHLRAMHDRPPQDIQPAADIDLMALLQPLMPPPELSPGGKPAAAATANDAVRREPVPLPDLSALMLPPPAITPDARAEKASAGASDASMVALSLDDLMPPPPALKKAPEVREHDLYRMDIPSSKPAAASGMPLLVLPESPAQPADYRKREAPAAAVSAPAPARRDGDRSGEALLQRMLGNDASRDEADRASLRSLRPAARPKKPEASAFNHIDSAVEVPPLKF